MAIEVLNQQQAARLGQWGEAAGPFLQGSVAFPLPQQIAHLAQPGMARFPHQLLRAASWGLGANIEDESVPSASTGPPFTRLDETIIYRSSIEYTPDCVSLFYKTLLHCKVCCSYRDTFE